MGEKFGPATSYRKTIIRPIAQSWWSAHKVKSLSNKLYLDKLKEKLKKGDSHYIKNAMLLNQLGAKEVMKFDPCGSDELNLSQSERNLKFTKSITNFKDSNHNR